MPSQPSKIGKYKILSQIGKGGMGAVFKAEHPTLKHTVIIKQLTTADSDDVIERFRREARIMMDFRNERIVQVFDHFKEGNAFFIVMEYVDGINLEDLISENRYLPDRAAAVIVNEICKALKYAHDHQIIHRDIKPANILISKDGLVKLVDFGVSASLDADSLDGLTKAGMTIGTPSYLAPEQIANAGNRDKRTDIYSLGVVFYEMLVGKKPFQGGFTPENIAAIEKGRYIPPRKINPKISPRLQRVVKKAMHHKVNKRFQDLSQIQKKLSTYLKPFPTQESINLAIQEYLEGKADLILKEGRRLKIRVSIPRRPAILVSAVLLLLAVGSGTAFWTLHRGYQYEYLFPDRYGALQVQIDIRHRNKALEEMYLKPILFFEEKGRLHSIDTVRFDFQPIASDRGSNYETLISQPVYLKAGNYMALFYFENEQYRQTFYLAPRSLQKHRHDTRAARMLSFTVATPPRLPVKLTYKLTDRHSGRALSDQNEAIAVFDRGKWVDWQTFLQSGSNVDRFRSGNRFRFRFKHKGYYTAYSNVTIQPEQSILKLHMSLIPLPGELHVKSSSPDVDLLINSRRHYLTGGKDQAFRELPPLSDKYQKLILAPGDLFLTARNPRLYFNATSTTQKLTIVSGQKVYVDIRIDPEDQSIGMTTQ